MTGCLRLMRSSLENKRNYLVGAKHLLLSVRLENLIVPPRTFNGACLRGGVPVQVTEQVQVNRLMADLVFEIQYISIIALFVECWLIFENLKGRLHAYLLFILINDYSSRYTRHANAFIANSEKYIGSYLRSRV